MSLGQFAYASNRVSLMLCDGIHPHFEVSPLGQLAKPLPASA